MVNYEALIRGTATPSSRVALQRLIASLGIVRFDEGASDCGTATGEAWSKGAPATGLVLP